MTNTRVSDLEILEKRCPVLVKQFSLRPNSGGKGLHPGGNGAIRAFQARAAMTFALTSERRSFRPNGMAGGGPGEAGKNLALLKLPDGGNRWVNLGGNGIVNLKYGESLYINTPGGGAWGAFERTGNGITNGTGNQMQQPPQYWRGNGSLSNFAATQLEG
jgi:5-oxoprolinase (ATP-hydrolysing)